MLVIRCTAKLRKVGRWPVEEPTGTDDADTGGTDTEWYANLLWFERRKCILFTHGATLYTFLVPDVVKKDLDDIGSLLRDNLYDQLIYDGIDLNHAVPILRTEDPPVIAVARNRSILGSMNELAIGYAWAIHSAGGLQHVSRRVASRNVNWTPMTRIGYGCPQNAMREYVGYPEVRGANHGSLSFGMVRTEPE